MTALPQDVVADLRRRVAELEQRLESALAERDEAIAQQAATAEVLQVINASPGDLAPVFDAIVERAARLCAADGGALWLVDGDTARATGGRGGKMPEAFYDYVEHESVPVKFLLGRDQDRPFVHVVDLKATKPYQDGIPFFVANVELGRVRTSLSVPLKECGCLIGIFTLIRWQVQPFTDKQIAVVQSFADQAQIAMKNAGLLSELGIAGDRQAASAEILRAIASTPGDAERPLQQIAETTARLFGASSVTLNIASGGEWVRMIRVGPSSQRVGSELSAAQLGIGGRNLPATVFRENRQIHIPDLDNLDPAIADWPSLPHARAAGARAMAGTPLRREGKAIGALIVHRDRPTPFSDEELALLQSVADQAVIAIENARLFNETQEALEQQKATSDLLQVIGNSVADTAPVFEKILDSCQNLFATEQLGIFLVQDGQVHVPAWRGGALEAMVATLPRPVEQTATGLVIQSRNILHLPSAAAMPNMPPTVRSVYERIGDYSLASAPMLREQRGVGALVALRQPPKPFSDKELALLKTFADQAVIAIENTRLFNETREALERQTATADILKVIASSPSDVQPVFDVIVERAVRLCGGRMGRVYRYDGDMIEMVAAHGLSMPGLSKVQQVFPRPATDDTIAGQVMHSHRPYFVPDIESDESVPLLSRQMIEAMGTRSQVTIPMLRSGEPIGAITVGWADPGAYNDQQVLLLRTFADQAVIAIENVRLFNETREALERQTATADILQAIGSSMADAQPVFEAIAASANRLIGGFSSTVFRFIDGIAYLKAFTPTTPAADEILKATFPRPVGDFPPFQMAQAGEVTQIPDTEALSDEILGISRARGFRSMLFAPLINDGVSIGFIAVTRVQPGTFADHHVQLLRTFADQAVIAIENARLFEEVQARTQELTVSLEQQTATSEVLSVISSSDGDLVPVFDAMLGKAMQLCGADFGVLNTFDGKLFHTAATRGLPPAYDEYR